MNMSGSYNWKSNIRSKLIQPNSLCLNKKLTRLINDQTLNNTLLITIQNSNPIHY